MIGEATRVGVAVLAVMGAGLVVACSGADSGATEVQGFSDFAIVVDSPTGTLDVTTARPVVEAFEKAASASRQGDIWRIAPMDDTSEATCASGGSVRTNGTGDESSGAVRVSYNGCCVEGGCCLDGIWHVAHDEASSGTSPYSVCMKYDVSSTCDSASETVDYVSCTDKSGSTIYAVQVEGKRFSVSGSEKHGGGALTIVDARGTWTCSVDDGAGRCSGPTGAIAF